MCLLDVFLPESCWLAMLQIARPTARLAAGKGVVAKVRSAEFNSPILSTSYRKEKKYLSYCREEKNGNIFIFACFKKNSKNSEISNNYKIFFKQLLNDELNNCNYIFHEIFQNICGLNLRIIVRKA